jgi:hypothetical protein
MPGFEDCNNTTWIEVRLKFAWIRSSFECCLDKKFACSTPESDNRLLPGLKVRPSLPGYKFVWNWPECEVQLNFA